MNVFIALKGTHFLSLFESYLVENSEDRFFSWQASFCLRALTSVSSQLFHLHVSCVDSLTELYNVCQSRTITTLTLQSRLAGILFSKGRFSNQANEGMSAALLSFWLRINDITKSRLCTRWWRPTWHVNINWTSFTYFGSLTVLYFVSELTVFPSTSSVCVIKRLPASM